MNKFILASLMGFLLWGALPAAASGCMWYDKYEPGVQLTKEVITGHFFCQDNFGYKTCQFIENGDSGRKFQSEAELANLNSPPLTDLRVEVITNAAMHWQDCDGGDPVPDFVPNGIYSSFEFDGNRYFLFKPTSSLFYLSN